MVPLGWKINFQNNGKQTTARDVRGKCPHCKLESTYFIQSQVQRPVTYSENIFHLVMQCNYSQCAQLVYIRCVAVSLTLKQDDVDFFIYPYLSIESPHPSIPPAIGEDWLEAQRAMGANAPKAAAVMCRRVLYGAMLNKGCKEHPLHEGLKELIQNYRLPAIFDDWLNAIKDDGHDSAHPSRALTVSHENVVETMEYTAEMLRYLYIEPYEFQQRKARIASGA